jgi:hypothetical protein
MNQLTDAVYRAYGTSIGQQRNITFVCVQPKLQKRRRNVQSRHV